MHNTHTISVCKFCGKIKRPGVWEDTSNKLLKNFLVAEATEYKKVLIVFEACHKCTERETKKLDAIKDEPQKGSGGSQPSEQK
jgi:NMD protein affecting ribosome stability and mRNA decay